MSHDYFIGCDCLGAEDLEEPVDIFGDLDPRAAYEELDEARGVDIVALGAESKITVEDVTPPSYVSTQGPVASSPILEYGPPLSGAGSPMRYTDKPTITAVQKKLKALGFFPYTVDGRFGPQTDSAILNYTASYGPAQHGPPDDALLKKLGLAQGIAFLDEEVDSMKVQAKSASSPAEVKVVAAKVEKLVSDSPALPPEIKKQAQEATLAAQTASTPAQAAAAKEKVEAVIAKIPSQKMPAWQIGLIAAGAAVGLGALLGGISMLRRS